MELSLYFEKLIKKRRLMMIVSTGVILIIITLYVTTSNATEVISIPKKNSTQTDNISSNSVTYKEYIVNKDKQTTHDPFALYLGSDIPKGQIDSISPSRVTAEKLIPSKQQEEKKQPLPILTGIVSTTDKQIAIIQSENKSKAYQLNENIGEYQIKAINGDNVILTGFHGQVILQLQSSRENGGNNSEI